MNLNPEQFPEQFERLPVFLGSHLQLTLAALLIGIALTIPLTLLALRVRALQGPLLGIAAVIQTVPSLALLALMVPLLGQIGFLPAVIALILYSILPVLRNAVTGIEGTDPAMLEAAQGMGMTPNQTLLRVQLPLAIPIIIAGIRTATVWVVGIATLSTPVGATSLGNYIFQGLQTRNFAAVLVGCVAAAALALVLDSIIRTWEIGVARRKKPLLAASAVGGVLVLIGALLPNLQTLLRPAPGQNGTAQARPRVVLGAKTFTEQYILAKLLRQRLTEGNFEVVENSGMGSAILFDALAGNSIDVYIDYSGTIWANVLKHDETGTREGVLKKTGEELKEKFNVVSMGSLGFENAYALAMKREKAEKLGVRTLRDLARVAPNLVIGGDYEFFGRPEWAQLKKTYGFNFKKRVSMDSSLMYQAVGETENVDVISAFSSDGRIAAYDLVVLEDVGRAFPPYDAIILLSPNAAKISGLQETLQPLINSISDETMREANKIVDVDGGSIEKAAEYLDQVIAGKP
ncbi:MAG: glycine betaine ABC transporter substrate-binding protein [Armatimonadaceae bacterium]